MPQPTTNVAAHLVWDCDFPHPDWPRIRASRDPNFPHECGHELSVAEEREWLTLLRAHLGGAYALRDNDRSFLLSEQPETAAIATLAYIEHAIVTLTDALEGNVEAPVVRKHVVLIFTEEDDYYSYISHFFPDGHYGLQGGACVQAGEVHIAINGIKANLEEVLAHEFVHDLLAHLRLPLWIEEGIAEVLPKYLLDRPTHVLPDAMWATLVQHWHWYGLAEFWSGQSFQRPDDLAYYSYKLGEALVRCMNAEDPQKFNHFLRDARRADSGESSCETHFGVSLIHFAQQVLGPGPWFPPEPLLDEDASPPAAVGFAPLSPERQGQVRVDPTIKLVESQPPEFIRPRLNAPSHLARTLPRSDSG
jgi:hypothetical protein